jgi:hypothetical protein
VYAHGSALALLRTDLHFMWVTLRKQLRGEGL